MATATNAPANGNAVDLPAPAVPPQPPKDRIAVKDDAVALFDTARFEHMQRVAKAMALCNLIPDHLRFGRDKRPLPVEEVVSNCLLVVNQAARWNMDPFAVAAETYVVGNKLGYQGKLVAGVVNARAGLDGRLSYAFTGEGERRTVTVSGKFVGESEPKTVTLSVAQAKTSNDMWRKDPDQKLCYSGATKWARRHCPEILLGILTDDDLERIRESQAAPPAPPVPADLDALARRLLAQAERPTAPAEDSRPDVDTSDEFAQAPADAPPVEDLPDARPAEDAADAEPPFDGPTLLDVLADQVNHLDEPKRAMELRTAIVNARDSGEIDFMSANALLERLESKAARKRHK